MSYEISKKAVCRLNENLSETWKIDMDADIYICDLERLKGTIS